MLCVLLMKNDPPLPEIEKINLFGRCWYRYSDYIEDAIVR